MTREEHLTWAKTRAMEYLAAGDSFHAVISMMSDLKKHPDLFNHKGMDIGTMILANNMCYDRDFVKRFIEGFR